MRPAWPPVVRVPGRAPGVRARIVTVDVAGLRLGRRGDSLPSLGAPNNCVPSTATPSFICWKSSSGEVLRDFPSKDGTVVGRDEPVAVLHLCNGEGERLRELGELDRLSPILPNQLRTIKSASPLYGLGLCGPTIWPGKSHGSRPSRSKGKETARQMVIASSSTSSSAKSTIASLPNFRILSRASVEMFAASKCTGFRRGARRPAKA
mmetsp:Transcript_49166/g.114990  ORF Transcript_49166/g.114990 Transcript_49166/m.114990 type:complete len:207 (-) Transcript_49166:3405-4025(-)